jgi:hypothetical protein
VEVATFTNNADRRAVAQMLFDLEWTLLAAIEEVLARRGGSVALTERRRSGRQLWQRVRMTHRAARLLAAARITHEYRGEGESPGSDVGNRGSGWRMARWWRHALDVDGAARMPWVEWLSGRVSGRSGRASGDSSGDGSADVELVSRGGRVIVR